MGVSPLTVCCGGGRANGFRGPEAPAESNADADADGDGGGGGRTTELCLGAWVGVMAEPCGDLDSAPALPASDAPSGIWTVSRGPLGRDAAPGPPFWRLFDLDGGANGLSAPDDETDAARAFSRLLETLDLFSGGDADDPPRAVTSTDCERLCPAAAESGFAPCDSLANEARCCDKMDRFSSMGVNMLWDFFWGNFFMAMSVFKSGRCGRSDGSTLTSKGGGGCGS